MDILVPFSIRKKELGGTVSEEARKLFTKIKQKPELAVGISAKGRPAHITLYKYYATTANGHRRLLFFSRHTTQGRIENWILLFYRTKGDEIGDNMSSKNPAFSTQLVKNMGFATKDLSGSTIDAPLYERF